MTGVCNLTIPWLRSAPSDCLKFVILHKHKSRPGETGRLSVHYSTCYLHDLVTIHAGKGFLLPCRLSQLDTLDSNSRKYWLYKIFAEHRRPWGCSTGRPHSRRHSGPDGRRADFGRGHPGDHLTFPPFSVFLAFLRRSDIINVGKQN